MFYSSVADRAKLLEDSTESESELLQAETDPLVPSKDGPATAAVASTLSGNDEQKQSGPWESPAQPPPYESGTLTGFHIATIIMVEA